MIGLYILIGVVVLLVVVLVGIYNGLVRKRIRCREAWSQIDVQLKRRYDLIPNLVATVKGYAAHEQETLERVIQARNAAIAAGGVKEQAQAENVLTGALRQIFALSESYPDLWKRRTGVPENIVMASKIFNIHGDWRFWVCKPR